jgi:hypothetical protein
MFSVSTSRLPLSREIVPTEPGNLPVAGHERLRPPGERVGTLKMCSITVVEPPTWRLEMNRFYRAGLVVLGVLSLGDLSAPLLTDGEHPPMSIALIGSALGLVSLVLCVLAWRGAKAAAIALVVVRVLSALTAVPAFTVGGVPTVAMVLAGVAITLTLVAVVLVLSGLRQLQPVGAR